MQSVDSSLIGYWYGIVRDGSDYFGVEALDIGRDSDSTYSIVRYGKAVKGDMILPDTSHFTGYVVYLDNEPYLNIMSTVVSVTTRGKKKEPVVSTQRIYHFANFSLRNDTLTVRTVSENFSPVKKTFRDPAELRQALVAARGQGSLFDDLFSLSYRRIPRPGTMKGF